MTKAQSARTRLGGHLPYCQRCAKRTKPLLPGFGAGYECALLVGQDILNPFPQSELYAVELEGNKLASVGIEDG
jgi:hypothetical protein